MANVLAAIDVVLVSFEHEVNNKNAYFCFRSWFNNVNRPNLCQMATCVELFGAILLF
jgi:hypothetical protein